MGRGLLILAAFALGCSSALTGSDGGSGGRGGDRTDAAPDVAVDLAPDAARDASGDAATCECRVEDFTLTLSWACFCGTFGGCADRKPAGGPERMEYPACGLTTDTDTFHAVGGPYVSVWDDSGALVGRQSASDNSLYQCPTDSSLKAHLVRAGRFPDATCVAGPDAGTDARDSGGVDASCSGPLIFCTIGSPGGQCSDAGRPAVCRDGQWTCEPPAIPGSQCACIGAPPLGCSCGSTGWSCPTPTADASAGQ